MSRITADVTATRIGEFQVLEKLGKGGMGTVYKGKDAAGNVLAIKVLAGDATADPELRMRFAQECQVTQKLDHPNIVRVLGFGLDGSRPYLVMEHVEGESLGDRLEREGRIPEPEAVRVISQIGQALDWAHQQKLIHRDVKPDNILLTTEGQAKLADLGLAKDLDGELNLTKTLSCLGTPNFMAPEQFQDAKCADALCDLYSLAATLYMTVTGEVPFRGHNMRALVTIFHKKLANDIASPRQLVPELSERLSDAILRALRADRGERQGSMEEFLQSLTEAGAPAASTAAVRLVEEPGKDHRAQKRYTSERGISCRPLQRPPDDHWAGLVRNISQTGLCLELNRRFEPGAMLTLVLDGEEGRRCCLVVRVVWTRKEPPKMWRLGCQLDRPLCDFELERLR